MCGRCFAPKHRPPNETAAALDRGAEKPTYPMAVGAAAAGELHYVMRLDSPADLAAALRASSPGH